MLGDDSTEATASLEYNRNRKILTADVVIPDYNVEAGIKLAVTDSDVKGKKMHGITIDVTNRNVPQLTLVGRTRCTVLNTNLQSFLGATKFIVCRLVYLDCVFVAGNE